MIIRENGLRFAKLIHVSVDNGKTHQSNKFYIMEELDNGTIKCTYGRVGEDKSKVDIKSSSKWDSVYKEKTKKKGYADKTEEAVIKQADKKNSTLSEIAEKEVRQLFEDLMAYANKTIGANYKVTQDEVTQKQIDNAQKIIDELSKTLKSSTKKSEKIKPLNDKLLELYMTIPRRMKNVKEHLFNDTDFTIEQMKDKIAEEQDLLDTMAGQVLAIAQTTTTSDDDDQEKQENLLEKLGLEVTLETDKKAIDLVKKLLGKNANQLNQVFKVINKTTQEKFDKHYASATHKKRQLLWHGSRNQNWFNIIQTGLLIRPAGAIYTGSMFGDGIYFANKAQKSIGYSSLSGSYWARGNDQKGYLALFDVHIGKQYDVTSSDSSLNQKKLDAKGGYDCTFAHAGGSLYNDEIIVYEPKRCTIAYLVELNN
jgi:poly [ADP-ribose] polymerase 2/3/4